MKEIKQNNGANKTKRTCTLKNILYVTTLSILKNWTFILMVIRFKKVTKRKQLGIYIDENLQRLSLLNHLIKNLSAQTIVFIYSSRGTKALLSRLHPYPHSEANIE